MLSCSKPLFVYKKKHMHNLVSSDRLHRGSPHGTWIRIRCRLGIRIQRPLCLQMALICIQAACSGSSTWQCVRSGSAMFIACMPCGAHARLHWIQFQCPCGEPHSLISCSTTVATAKWSTCKGTLHCAVTVDPVRVAAACSEPSEYPHSYSSCSSHRSMVLLYHIRLNFHSTHQLFGEVTDQITIFYVSSHQNVLYNSDAIEDLKCLYCFYTVNFCDLKQKNWWFGWWLHKKLVSKMNLAHNLTLRPT